MGMRGKKSSDRQRGGRSFDQNRLGQFPTDSQPGIANLANIRGFAPNQFDLLFLTETQLAQAIGYIRRGRELFDAYDRSCLDLA